jgi:hypothetical protein
MLGVFFASLPHNPPALQAWHWTPLLFGLPEAKKPAAHVQEEGELGVLVAPGRAKGWGEKYQDLRMTPLPLPPSPHSHTAIAGLTLELAVLVHKVEASRAGAGRGANVCRWESHQSPGV